MKMEKLQLNNIKEGDKIKINNKKYEVVKTSRCLRPHGLKSIVSILNVLKNQTRHLFWWAVLDIRIEADPSPRKNPPIRIYKSLELHKIGDKSLLPESHLNIYEDNNQIIFFDIEEIKEEDIKIIK